MAKLPCGAVVARKIPDTLSFTFIAQIPSRGQYSPGCTLAVFPESHLRIVSDADALVRILDTLPWVPDNFTFFGLVNFFESEAWHFMIISSHKIIEPLFFSLLEYRWRPRRKRTGVHREYFYGEICIIFRLHTPRLTWHFNSMDLLVSRFSWSW